MCTGGGGPLVLTAVDRMCVFTVGRRVVVSSAEAVPTIVSSTTVRNAVDHKSVPTAVSSISVKIARELPSVHTTVGKSFASNASDHRFVCTAEPEITANPVEGRRSVCMTHNVGDPSCSCRVCK